MIRFVLAAVSIIYFFSFFQATASICPQAQHDNLIGDSTPKKLARMNKYGYGTRVVKVLSCCMINSPSENFFFFFFNKCFNGFNGKGIGMIIQVKQVRWDDFEDLFFEERGGR